MVGVVACTSSVAHHDEACRPHSQLSFVRIGIYPGLANSHSASEQHLTHQSGGVTSCAGLSESRESAAAAKVRYAGYLPFIPQHRLSFSLIGLHLEGPTKATPSTDGARHFAPCCTSQFLAGSLNRDGLMFTSPRAQQEGRHANHAPTTLQAAHILRKQVAALHPV